MGGGRDGDSDGSNFLGKGGGGINTLQIRLDQLLGSWWQPLCQARYHKTEAIFNNDQRWYWRTTRVFLPFLSHPLLTRHRLISNTQFLPFFDPFFRFFFSSKQIPKKCSRDKCKLAVVFLIILSFFSFPFFPPFLLIVSQSLTTFLRGTFLFRGWRCRSLKLGTSRIFRVIRKDRSKI